MGKHAWLVLGLFFSSVSPDWAQTPDAISPVAPLRNAPPGTDPALGVVRGQAITVSIDDLPETGREPALRALEQDRVGFETVDDRQLAEEQDVKMRMQAPGSQALRSMKFRVAPPRTGLARYAFVGTIPGLVKDGKAVMATRVFTRPDGVLIDLEEWRFAENGGAVVSVRELMNAHVGSRPARIAVQKSPAGLSRTTLTWNDGRIAYALRCSTTSTIPRRAAPPTIANGCSTLRKVWVREGDIDGTRTTGGGQVPSMRALTQAGLRTASRRTVMSMLWPMAAGYAVMP